MTRTLTLPIEEAVAFGKVIKFLNSKAKKSEQTKKGYSIAFAHFHFFLKTCTKHNLETILDPLKNKEINVYELLDDFGGYLENRVDVYNKSTKL